jgi:hypothetical protein
VDAHRDQYAVAVAIQAAVMAKAARALITLHEGLHDDVGGGARTTMLGSGGGGFCSAFTCAFSCAVCAALCACWYGTKLGGGGSAKRARSLALRPGIAAKTRLTVALAIVLECWRM